MDNSQTKRPRLRNPSRRYWPILEHFSLRKTPNKGLECSMSVTGPKDGETTGMKTPPLKLILVVLTFSQHLTLLKAESPPPAGSLGSAGTPTTIRDPNVRQTGWPSIPLPKITMPHVTMPKVTMPDMSMITKPVKSGFSKITTGTKKAWEGTKEVFTLGGNKSQQTAPPHASQKQGFWSRLFSPELEKPSGPQTVGEWMAQPRLDP